MAEIRGFGPFRHLRAESASHVLEFVGGELRRSGRGLAFWFWPWSTSLAEVPLEDREVVIAFHGRSADFQDVLVQGALTYRIVDPALAAQRVDFSIHASRGTHIGLPLEKIAGALAQAAQQYALATVQASPLRELVGAGPSRLRAALEAGLADAPLLHDLGIELVAVRADGVRPEAEVERALEAPTREHIQQQSDEAAFQRRAMAVDKERAIQENELQNQIELARREADLIDRRGQNAQRGRPGQADEVYRTMPPAVLVSLAAQELATKLQRIDHLQITPDLLAPLLGDLMSRAKGLPAKAEP